MSRPKLFLPLVLLASCPFTMTAPASADTICASGNFSTVASTTCDIGSLQFSFNGTTSYGGGWTSNDLYFTPSTNGFTLSFLPGAQSLSENFPYPYETAVFDEIGLNFDVTELRGNTYLSGVNVSGGTFEAAGPGAFASGGLITQSTAGGAGYYALCGSNPTPSCSLLSANYPAGHPFSSSASVNAIVFDLWATNGSARWDGSPSTYTFRTANDVPEPGTLTLLGIGLLSILALVRRRSVNV
jgi:hypothetical protein